MTVPATKPSTMGEALVLFKQDEGIDPARRQAIAADVKQAFIRSPDLRTAEPRGPALRAILKRYHFKKRQKNIRASVCALVRWVHEGLPASRGNSLNAVWSELLNDPALSRSAKYGIHRFATFCSAKSLLPADVTDGLVNIYKLHFESLDTKSDIKKSIYNLTISWNACCRKIEGWPGSELTPPPRREFLAPRLEDIGGRLADEIVACLEFIGQKKPHDDGPVCFQTPTIAKQAVPLPELEASTLGIYSRCLRRAVRIVSETSGRPFIEIHLREVVNVTTATTIMATMSAELYKKEAGIKPLLSMINCIISVATHYFKLCDEAIALLKKLGKQIERPSKNMTKKNIARLKQIVGEKRDELFRLPAKLMDSALEKIKNGTHKRCDLLDGAAAAAIAFMLNIQLRIGSLCAIEINTHLTLSRVRGKPSWVTLPESLTKNDLPVDRRVPADLAALLICYEENIRPLLFPDLKASKFLFPGRGRAGHKNSGGFSMQISKRISEHLGIEMNPHLFRHLGAIMYLELHPGDYHVATILLGNRSVDTVRRVYSGLELHAAHEKGAASLAERKKQAGLDPKSMLKVDRRKQPGNRKLGRKAA